jgi:hypothetical protein
VRFANAPAVDQATPADTARLHRLQRWIKTFRWVMAVAVFVPLADFLGGVDLAELVRHASGEGAAWPPASVLGLFFAALISGTIAWTFGVAAEWACRHRLERAHHDAAVARIAETAVRTAHRS